MFKNIPKPYPGRMVVIGKDGNFYVGLYAVTARSAASRAKRYVLEEESVVVQATDEEIMAQGDLDLLSYTAMRLTEGAIIIGNGRQTDIVSLFGEDAKETLATELQHIEFEPDKYRTPRVTGCIQNNGGVTGALHVAREKEGALSRDTFGLQMVENEGLGICTYSGPNVRPTFPYRGDPFRVDLNFGNAKFAAESLYKSLEPQDGEEDLRVSVVVVYWNRQGRDVFIVNAVD